MSVLGISIGRTQ